MTSANTKKKVRRRKLPFAFTIVWFTVQIKQSVNLHLQSVKQCETKSVVKSETENTPRTDRVANNPDATREDWHRLASNFEHELNMFAKFIAESECQKKNSPTEMRYQQSLYRNTELNDKLNASNALLASAEQAIDALLIFGHQHTMKPLLREMYVLERIRRHLKTEGK